MYLAHANYLNLKRKIKMPTFSSDHSQPNLNLVRWGAKSGDATAAIKQIGLEAGIGDMNLWLNTWAGEVLHAYDAYNIFESLVDQRTIDSGTTIEFPVTGTIALNEAWESGEELSGGGTTTSTFTISLDRRPIAAHFELDNIDLMREQFEFRSELARQAGLTLANERDRQIARLLHSCSVEGSRVHNREGETPTADLDTSGVFEGMDTRYSGRIYNADGSTNFDDLSGEKQGLFVLAAIEKEMVKYKELDIPDTGLVAVIPPAVFNEIRRLGIAHVSHGGPTGTGTAFNQGGYSDPLFMGIAQATSMSSTLDYMGCTIMASNHISQPQGNYVAGDANYQIPLSPFINPADGDDQADANRALQGNFRGAIFSRGAVASVRKQGLKVDTVEDVRRNTVFTVASTYMGGGILRPELCASIWNLAGVTTDGNDGTANNGFDNRASRQAFNAGTDVQISV
jgi:hypothetical protein